MLVGCDFSSSPTRRKPIVIASGSVAKGRVLLHGLERLESLDEFARWLALERSWIGGFDFPFGLPRQLLDHLGWPLEWQPAMRHYAALPRSHLRSSSIARPTATPM